MIPSEDDCDNPYLSPHEPSVPRMAVPPWHVAIGALICVVMPCVLTWTILESPLMAREEDQTDSIRTPNPQKAPWVSQTQELMMWTNPRLALFAYYWCYVVYLSAALWALAAPWLFKPRSNAGPVLRLLQKAGQIPTSLIVGAILAWPWLAVILIPSWLGP